MTKFADRPLKRARHTEDDLDADELISAAEGFFEALGMYNSL
jgi:hypothetical protein